LSTIQRIIRFWEHARNASLPSPSSELVQKRPPYKNGIVVLPVTKPVPNMRIYDSALNMTNHVVYWICYFSVIFI